MKRIGTLVILLVTLCATSVGAQSDNGAPSGGDTPLPPLPTDGTWTQFCWFGGVGSLNDEGPFTFSPMGPAVLDVTDAFIDGDAFDVLDGGTSIGMTSIPVDTGSSQGDPDLAFADPDYSSGSFALAAGSYSITLQLTAAATGFTSGCGFLRVMPAAPTAPPLALAALALALIGAGFFLMRRRVAV